MKRRDFILSGSALTLLPAAVSASTGIAYNPGLVEKELAAGKTVFLDFYTSWCTTCASQGRTIEALRAADPAYDEAITFISIDWDIHSDAPISRSLNIPRRSTLVVLKGDKELGRIVAGTRNAEIKALLDTALAASA
ncbi:MAG: thioredoxin family protein [Alphaproteobacteria bacterium]|nr:thioredoxin family protein [Alphaproteobacteria bacterium]NNF23780.1 thioredoxin family protein [Paracoccaceae bacterium]